MLTKIKLALRIDSSDLDMDIQETIDAAKADLELSGVIKEKITEKDSLILRAVKIYCKAEYSTDDKEADRYSKSYGMLKNHLCLSKEYTEEVQI